MGILEMASRVWIGNWQRGKAAALRVSRRLILGFILLCLSPVLVPVLLLIAIPLGFFLIAFIHLPRLWRRFRPSPFRRGLAFHGENFGTPPPPSRLRLPYAARRQSEDVFNPPPSPTSHSGSWSIEDTRDSKGSFKRGQAPASSQHLASGEDERFWHCKEMQEALMLSGSTSPSDFTPSPRGPSAGQDESAALARRIRKEITGLKKFVGDESPSRGSLLKEIEDLGTFLGIDLPIATSPEADLQRAEECVQLLKLVVGVQFR